MLCHLPLFFFSIPAFFVECQGSGGYLMQKTILIRSIKRKGMLLSKPFTLNYSIELYLQATETKTTKTFPWHQIKSQQNQLFISFILTILFNYVQGLSLIGKTVIQKVGKIRQIFDHYNLGKNRNQLPHNRTLENLTSAVFKFICTNKTSIYANKIKCVAARTLPVSEVARKRTCRQTNNSHEYINSIYPTR